MRLTSITLANYGPFQSQRIDFDPAPGRLNLLIAPNGFGKSVLRGAFCDLLFGIPGQSGMSFRYGYNGMRLAAEALGPDGAPFRFGRRKGNGNTLIDEAGAPLDAATLARLLGRTDRVLLERLFALDTERLRRGGEELLASEGAVADALLSAAGGLRQARQLRQGLETARDQLAPKRKSQNRPFYQGLDRLLDAGRRIEATMLRPELRDKQEKELAELNNQLHRENKIAQAASLRISRMERVRRVLGLLRQHEDAAAWLAAHPEAPVLPEDTGERLARADEALRRAELLLARERQECEAASLRTDSLVPDAALLHAGSAIDSMVKRAGAAERAAGDIPKRQRELEVTEQQIAVLLHQLGATLPVERAGEAIPRDAVVAEARRLFTEREKRRAEQDRLPAELAQAARDIEASEAALARLPPPIDTGLLAREAREIRRAGDPSARAQDVAQAVAERTASRDAAIARIPAWGTAALALKVQPVAAYERLDAALGAHETALASCLRAVRDLREAEAAEQARLGEVAATGPLPDAASIAASRVRRDRGWVLVYRRAFTPDLPSTEEERAWAGELPLALAYERAVAHADALADRASGEAGRLAQAAEIARRIADLQARLTEAETARLTAGAGRDAARLAWETVLAPLALPAETGMQELRALLAGREKIIDAQRDLDAATEAAAQLHAWQEAAAARLRHALGLGQAAPDLPALLADAERRIEAARQADEARARLRDRLDAQRRIHAEKTDALAASRRAWEQLSEAWAKLRTELHRPADESPATTVALLDGFAKLDTATQAAATLRQRLREMADELARFDRDAASLAFRLAPDLPATDASAAVEALRVRLAEQREMAAQKADARDRLQRAEASLAAQQQQQVRAAVELQAILTGLGAPSVADAQPIVALAAERARIADAHRQAARDLTDAGDGLNLDELRAEAALFAIDSVPGEIAAAQAEREAAMQNAQGLAARIATATQRMDLQARETATMQAVSDQQAASATLSRVLDEAALLHIASLILDHALNEVDEAGASVLLARIGTLFRTMTGGTYERIVTEPSNDGGARLRAVERRFPTESKAVAELSDGTRDQLFLALRLAAIEEHVATAPPLPFIGDDILQTLDDDCATAAMRALTELSHHAQVILLSHHPHLLGLARSLGPDQVHICAIGPEMAL